MTIEPMSKKVVIDELNGSISYLVNEEILSNFKLDDIIGIGEVVTDWGPFMDDHFLMFITKSKIWHTIPTDAKGFSELTNFIGNSLGILSFVQITNVTRCKTRIIYPKK